MSNDLDKMLESKGSYNMPDIVSFSLVFFKRYEIDCKVNLSFRKMIEIMYELGKKLGIEHPIIRMFSDYLSEKDPQQQIKKMEKLKEYIEQQLEEIPKKKYELAYISWWRDSGLIIKKNGCVEEGKEKDILTEYIYNFIAPKRYGKLMNYLIK